MASFWSFTVHIDFSASVDAVYSFHNEQIINITSIGI